MLLIIGDPGPGATSYRTAACLAHDTQAVMGSSACSRELIGSILYIVVYVGLRRVPT